MGTEAILPEWVRWNQKSCPNFQLFFENIGPNVPDFCSTRGLQPPATPSPTPMNTSFLTRQKVKFPFSRLLLQKEQMLPHSRKQLWAGLVLSGFRQINAYCLFRPLTVKAKWQLCFTTLEVLVERIRNSIVWRKESVGLRSNIFLCVRIFELWTLCACPSQLFSTRHLRLAWNFVQIVHRV